ncbi:hypothetical protein WICMUC_000939 [Wickerhamomyces mucosus]|uniref:Uncharacterized protein n=1 Tax=Wickerhamomyces mucosus TaxID=1378264 RepID=A0A9P8PY97_9ASCO|nr:hypothetical protein WICMUC_000939 [Wickerhamomyces mucosus]
MSRRVPVASANKEETSFKEALKLYEGKQYKKSIKICEQILKKNSNYAEAYALKALDLYHLKEFEESEAYVGKALAKNPDSPITNHILGILRRQQQNYKDASKYFKKAMASGSTNQAIWRDLSVMELQNRDYKNLTKSRHAYLEAALGYRANWTGLAIAHHLNNDFNAAEKTLVKIEELVKGKLSEAELYENSELELYKNEIIAEVNTQSALKNLESLNTLDKYSELETKGKYLLKLERFEEAQKVYRELLKRNPDDYKYYKFLEVSLKSLNKSKRLRVGLYDKLAKFYPKSDAPKFIPLTFLKSTDEEFEPRLRAYLLSQLKRGAPATFQNVKPLYKDQSKVEVIEKIVLEYLSTLKDLPIEYIWTNYFLSLHYLRQSKLNDALKYVESAIDHTPTIVELYILKARVLKHFGNLEKACETINYGRELDLQDRFINSKTVKYYLRNNNVDRGLEIASIFTKNDTSTNGLKDLHTMQASWFVIENGEAFYRLYKETKDIKFLGLALKRFQGIVKIFEEYYNDQLDFHTFCLRKGTARAYLQMLNWEDSIFTSPIYQRAIKSVSSIYFHISDERLNETEDVYEKLNKKEKIAKIKQAEQDKVKFQAYTDDNDIYGDKLIKVKSLLEEFNGKFFHHLINQGPDLIFTNEIQFQLQYKLKKIALVLGSLNKIIKADEKNVRLPYFALLLKFSDFTDVLSKKLIERGLERFDLKDLKQFVYGYITDDYQSILTLVQIHNLSIEGLQDLKNDILERIKHLEPYEQFELLTLIK